MRQIQKVDAVRLLRTALSRIPEEEDRLIFRSVITSKPGPGRAIQNPQSHGFVSLSAAITDSTLLRSHTLSAPNYASNRLEMFSSIITIIHRLGPNFSMYLGRTFLRPGQEHLGPRARFRSHMLSKDMSYGRVLARVPRDRVCRDEELGMRLVEVWDAVGSLCCNKDVFSGRLLGNSSRLSSGTRSYDLEQVIYLCLSKR